MAVLRLFAQAKDAAGVSSVTCEGDTVADVVTEARRRFGVVFSEVVDNSTVWLNGEEVDRATPVGDGDEVAILPPISGGAR